MNVLRKSGISTNIGYLKALLKELGLQWYGSTCTILALVKAAKEYQMSLSQRAFSGASDSGMMRSYMS